MPFHLLCRLFSRSDGKAGVRNDDGAQLHLGGAPLGCDGSCKLCVETRPVERKTKAGKGAGHEVATRQRGLDVNPQDSDYYSCASLAELPDGERGSVRVKAKKFKHRRKTKKGGKSSSSGSKQECPPRNQGSAPTPGGGGSASVVCDPEPDYDDDYFVAPVVVGNRAHGAPGLARSSSATVGGASRLPEAGYPGSGNTMQAQPKAAGGSGIAAKQGRKTIYRGTVSPYRDKRTVLASSKSSVDDKNSPAAGGRGVSRLPRVVESSLEEDWRAYLEVDEEGRYCEKYNHGLCIAPPGTPAYWAPVDQGLGRYGELPRYKFLVESTLDRVSERVKREREMLFLASMRRWTCPPGMTYAGAVEECNRKADKACEARLLGEIERYLLSQRCLRSCAEKHVSAYMRGLKQQGRLGACIKERLRESEHNVEECKRRIGDLRRLLEQSAVSAREKGEQLDGFKRDLRKNEEFISSCLDGDGIRGAEDVVEELKSKIRLAELEFFSSRREEFHNRSELSECEDYLELNEARVAELKALENSSESEQLKGLEKLEITREISMLWAVFGSCDKQGSSAFAARGQGGMGLLCLRVSMLPDGDRIDFLIDALSSFKCGYVVPIEYFEHQRDTFFSKVNEREVGGALYREICSKVGDFNSRLGRCVRGRDWLPGAELQATTAGCHEEVSMAL